MPREIQDVVADIASDMEAAPKQPITYSWQDFYTLNDARKLHESRKVEIAQQALEEHGFIVGYGDRVVMVSEDRYVNRVRRQV